MTIFKNGRTLRRVRGGAHPILRKRIQIFLFRTKDYDVYALANISFSRNQEAKVAYNSSGCGIDALAQRVIQTRFY